MIQGFERRHSRTRPRTAPATPATRANTDWIACVEPLNFWIDVLLRTCIEIALSLDLYDDTYHPPPQRSPRNAFRRVKLTDVKVFRLNEPVPLKAFAQCQAHCASTSGVMSLDKSNQSTSGSVTF